MNNEEIRNHLKSLQDLKYKEFNKSLSPDTDYEMIGVRLPIIRSYAKELVKNNSKEDLAEYILSKDVKYFEEIMLQGILIGYSKFDIKQIEALLDDYIYKIQGWAINDTAASSIKIKQKDQEEFFKYICKYKSNKEEFVVRFMVIMFKNNYINDEYVDKIIDILNNIKTNNLYYIQMGIAWTIADIAVKYEEKVVKYLESKNNKLDDFTFNKSIQKMRESYRIKDETKEYLKSLKR